MPAKQPPAASAKAAAPVKEGDTVRADGRLYRVVSVIQSIRPGPDGKPRTPCLRMVDVLNGQRHWNVPVDTVEVVPV